MLSILRALSMARATFITLLFVLCLTASSIRAQGQQSHSHKKAASAHGGHRRASAATTSRAGKTRTAHRATSRSSRRSSRYPTPRRTASHHRATLVRSSAGIHQFPYMMRSSAAPHARVLRGPESAPSASPLAGTRSGAEVAEADTNDDAATDDTSSTPTAQEAANKIAAAELPARHASIAAVTKAVPSNRIMAMAPLRGSLESLIRQNEKINADNLERIEDDADLESRISSGVLVRVPESGSLAVNAGLPENRRYCRPWTASFLKDLARDHEVQFHRAFEVSSAVRTVAYQKRLMRTNGNAAPAEGDVASPHLTGATIDIAKSGMSRTELYWMRNRLNALQNEGKIDVEEEFRQSCFHITVYKSYVGAGPAHKPHKAAPPADAQPDMANSDAPATGD